jgi:hypothetical protein
MTSPAPASPDEPSTEAGRATAGKVCWALHALTMEHNPDCTVIREGIVAIEREAFWQGVVSVEEVHNPEARAASASVPLTAERLATAEHGHRTQYPHEIGRGCEPWRGECLEDLLIRLGAVTTPALASVPPLDVERLERAVESVWRSPDGKRFLPDALISWMSTFSERIAAAYASETPEQPA